MTTRFRSALYAPLILLSAFAHAADELDAMLSAMLAHDIKAAPGYMAKVIAPPGEMYDPLVMRVRGRHVWLNDDGKVLGDKGSRLLAVDKDGNVDVLVDADKSKSATTKSRYRWGRRYARTAKFTA